MVHSVQSDNSVNYQKVMAAYETGLKMASTILHLGPLLSTADLTPLLAEDQEMEMSEARVCHRALTGRC